MSNQDYKTALNEIFQDVRNGRISVERADILIKILDRLVQ